MNIIVCIKQVPDTNEVKIDRETNTLIRKGVPSIINPFDENAIEAALQLKEQYGGKVTVVSMGPPQVETALKDAIALGVDEVVLVTDRVFAGADTWATSYTLSKAIDKLGAFDLIICGKQAIDGDTAQVGPGIAEFLKLPIVTYVRKVVEQKDGSLIMEKEFEDGYEVMKTPLPAVITVTKEINVPRLPSLKGKMKAKTIQVPTWSAADIGADPESAGLKGSPTKVMKIFNPPVRTDREKLEGEAVLIATTLVARLKERKVI
ncbi:MAG: electron transfer flavoprotein subunit beta/FixA family protein [Candidatus Margulisiibacteriota bacterium]|jgi:electron transfer flavoprotein beta subunit